MCAALKNSFVFKGISEPMLLQVVNRMVGICVRAGTVVLQQGALPQVCSRGRRGGVGGGGFKTVVLQQGRCRCCRAWEEQERQSVLRVVPRIWR